MPVEGCADRVLTAICAIAASCSSNGSPTIPAARAGGAIIGHVTGFSTTSSQRHLDGSSSVATQRSPSLKTYDDADGFDQRHEHLDQRRWNGQFELTGVPPGDVTLKFSGAGVNVNHIDRRAGLRANQYYGDAQWQLGQTRGSGGRG